MSLLDSLNEYGAHLITVLCVYLIFRYARMLYHHKRKWVLSGFVIAMITILSAILLERGWAGLARAFSPEGVDYHWFFDQWRGVVNFISALIFAVGVYLYEAETMEIKDHPTQVIIYLGLLGFSALLVLL